MPELTLKFADLTLLSEMVQFDRLCFGGLWSEAGYRRELDNPHSLVLVLTTPRCGEQEGAIAAGSAQTAETLLAIGCSWTIVEEAHLILLGVHPHHRQMGLGQLILYGLLSLARQRGLERATLEVRVSNQAALSLYQKFGFQVAGRRKQYYLDTGEDGLILWRGSVARPEFEQTLIEWRQSIETDLQRGGWRLRQNLTDIPLR